MKKPSWWDKPITWGASCTYCAAIYGIYLLGVGCWYAKYKYEERKLKEDLKNLSRESEKIDFNF